MQVAARGFAGGRRGGEGVPEETEEVDEEKEGDVVVVWCWEGEGLGCKEEELGDGAKEEAGKGGTVGGC